MHRSFPLLVFAAALAAPAALEAQSSAAGGVSPPAYRAEAFVGMHPLTWARTPITGPLVDAAGERPLADRAFALAYRAAPSGRGQSPTAVDYSLARDGPHGSVGYICLEGIAPQAPHEAAVFAGSDEGRLVGASLKYPLR